MAKTYKIEVVKCEYLNIRKQANSTSKSLGTVKAGYTGTATKVSDGWYYVPAKSGWMSAKYLKVSGSKTPTSEATKKATKKLTAAQKEVKALTAKYNKKIEAAKKAIAKAKKVKTTVKKDVLHGLNYKLHVEDDRDFLKKDFIRKRINPFTVRTGEGEAAREMDQRLIKATQTGAQIYDTGFFDVYDGKGAKRAIANIDGTRENNSKWSDKKTISDKRLEVATKVPKKTGVSTKSITGYTDNTLTKVVDLGASDLKYVDNTGSYGSLTKTGSVDDIASFEGTPTNAGEDALSSDYELYNMLNSIDYSDVNKYPRLFTHINRFKYPFIGSTLSKTKTYIYFSRPTLHLFKDDNNLRDEINNIPLYTYLYEENPLMLKSLTSKLSSLHGFNPFLSNKAESIEVPDEVIRTVEHGETYTGWKIPYARNTNESNTANQFSVQYSEDKDTNIYRIHKAWIEYMNMVMMGEITSSRYAITNKVLDYACSVYYFVCAADGETVLFWTKYTGVFPLNTPASAFSYSADAPIANPKMTVNYMYAMREDLDPKALAEFNYLSAGEGFGEYADIYNSSGYAMHNATLVGMPYIATDRFPATGSTRFKLKHRIAR